MLVCITEEESGVAFAELLIEKKVYIQWVHLAVHKQEFHFVRCYGKNFEAREEEIRNWLHQNKYIHENGLFAKDINLLESALKEKNISLVGNVELAEKIVQLIGVRKVGTDVKYEYIQGYEKINSYFKILSLHLCRLIFEELVDEENYSIEETTGKVLFFVSSVYPYFFDRLEPLIYTYLEHGAECMVAFTDTYRAKPENLLAGEIQHKLYAQNFSILNRLKKKGVYCVWGDRKILSLYHYPLCYFAHGYNKKLPPVIREKSDTIVGLQTTAYYTHTYFYGEKDFLNYFGEDVYHQMDYLVTSPFVKQWVDGLSELYGAVKWGNKIVPLGYTKQDAIYNQLNKLKDAKRPEKLKDMKKIILIVSLLNEENLCMPFYDKYPEVGFILRVHPGTLALQENREKYDEMSEKYPNLWLDKESSYAYSFSVSDAMIIELGDGLLLNYFHLNKPTLLVENMGIPHSMVLPTYKEESWYKACYHAESEEQISEYINNILEGKNTLKEEHGPYREFMSNGFDGQVSKRIYEYFER